MYWAFLCVCLPGISYKVLFNKGSKLSLGWKDTNNEIQIIYVLDILGWNNFLSKILVDSSGLEWKVVDPGCYRLQYFKDAFLCEVVIW